MSKVLVIGGGVAGLSAAIYALKNGHEVTICEQHRILGGNLTGWNRKGYHIDNCVHWLTGSNPHDALYDIWRDLGAITDEEGTIQNEKLFTCEHEGETLSLYSDLGKTIDEMYAISPEDSKKIRDFEILVKTAMRFSHCGGDNFDEGIKPLKLLPAIIPALKYVLKTTEDMGKTFHHPLLRKFFTSITGHHYSSLAFVYVAACFTSGDAAMPVGGSVAMEQRMEKRLYELGGKALTKKKAVKVNVEGDHAVSVTFEDGDTIEADQFIFCIDPKPLFSNILKMPLPADLKKLYADKVLPRFSSIHSAFGTDKELVSFKGTLLIDIPQEDRKVLRERRVVLREFSGEPSFSPEGKNLIQTMQYCSEKDAADYVRLAKDKTAYQQQKERLKAALRHTLEVRFPQLKDKLDFLDLWTPASYARYVGTEIGSYMGFILGPGRIPKPASLHVEGIKNLFMANQFLSMPGGLPIAANTGRLAALALEK